MLCVCIVFLYFVRACCVPVVLIGSFKEATLDQVEKLTQGSRQSTSSRTAAWQMHPVVVGACLASPAA